MWMTRTEGHSHACWKQQRLLSSCLGPRTFFFDSCLYHQWAAMPCASVSHWMWTWVQPGKGNGLEAVFRALVVVTSWHIPFSSTCHSLSFFRPVAPLLFCSTAINAKYCSTAINAKYCSTAINAKYCSTAINAKYSKDLFLWSSADERVNAPQISERLYPRWEVFIL
jgi:hypothetical protein